MEHLSQAYEALIREMEQKHKREVEDLKGQIDDLGSLCDEETFADVETIRMLCDFISSHHPPQEIMQLAKQIDVVNKRPGDMVDYFLCNDRFAHKYPDFEFEGKE